MTRGGVANRLPPPPPSTPPVTPVAGGGGDGGGPNTGDPPPSGWPEAPDPLPGRRVSIRPQPRRAPRGAVMALSPSQAGE